MLVASTLANLLSRFFVALLAVGIVAAGGLLIAVAAAIRFPSALFGLVFVSVFLIAVGPQFRKLKCSNLELDAASVRVRSHSGIRLIGRSDVISAVIVEETMLPLLLLWHRSAGSLELLVSHFAKRDLPALRAFEQSVQATGVDELRRGVELPLTSRTDVARARLVAGAAALASTLACIGGLIAWENGERGHVIVLGTLVGAALGAICALVAARKVNAVVEGLTLRSGAHEVDLSTVRLLHIGWGHLIVWPKARALPWLVTVPGEAMAREILRKGR